MNYIEVPAEEFNEAFDYLLDENDWERRKKERSNRIGDKGKRGTRGKKDGEDL